MDGRENDGREEFARRLRAYMGYADQTLDEVARSLEAYGVNASASTVNRWTRGQSLPNIIAAQALGRLVENGGLAEPGEGVTWLLGNQAAATPAKAPAVAPDLDRAVRNWQFRTASPALAKALAERGIPAPYRKPLADLLAQMLAEIEGDEAEPPLADGDATG